MLERYSLFQSSCQPLRVGARRFTAIVHNDQKHMRRFVQGGEAIAGTYGPERQESRRIGQTTHAIFNAGGINSTLGFSLRGVSVASDMSASVYETAYAPRSAIACATSAHVLRVPKGIACSGGCVDQAMDAIRRKRPQDAALLRRDPAASA